MQYTREASTHPHLSLVFGATLVDGQSDVSLPSFGGGVGYCMPVGGSIVGIAYTLDAATEAGALSIDLKVGSTQKNVDLSIGTSSLAGSALFDTESHRFAANQLIGVTYTSGTLTTNGDISVVLLVVLDDVRG